MQEIDALLASAFDPGEYRRVYAGFARPESALESRSRSRREISTNGIRLDVHPRAAVLRALDGRTPSLDIDGARALAIFGDSITTDHISPAGAIKPTSPAGSYLRGLGVAAEDFNSYGARRGNHEVMVRGTFANVRIRNLMVPGVEGGVTRHQPTASAWPSTTRRSATAPKACRSS